MQKWFRKGVWGSKSSSCLAYNYSICLAFAKFLIQQFGAQHDVSLNDRGSNGLTGLTKNIRV